MFKYQDLYYLITSSCTGWAPNEAEIAVSKSPLGPFKVLGNPCVGEGKEITFFSQSTDVLKLDEDKFIFIADRWNPDNLYDSRYLFLPIDIKDKKLSIKWHDEWDLTYFK